MKLLATKVKKYTKLTRMLFSLSLQTEFEYKANFVIECLAAILRVLSFWIFIEIVYLHVDSILGWNKYEIILIYGFFRLFWSLFEFCFFLNMKEFCEKITNEGIDFLLLKPISARFFISFYKFRIFRLAKTLAGLVLIVYSATYLNLTLSLPTILILSLSTVLLFFIFHSIFFSYLCLTFWFARIAHGYWLIAELGNIAKVPTKAHKYIIQGLFVYLVPFVLFSSIPAELILKRVNIWNLPIIFAISLLWYALSKYLWQQGLKKYSSIGG
jgi:ABC-2 type transport system permease protein